MTESDWLGALEHQNVTVEPLQRAGLSATSLVAMTKRWQERFMEGGLRVCHGGVGTGTGHMSYRSRRIRSQEAEPLEPTCSFFSILGPRPQHGATHG